ncbi:hypothetical protein HanRHA438_Chr13g0609851 [Helianthus annuus]|uniref:Uncharacterized protein n=1 Tax=Helianthus annuus TaxID=4232 RepID=A0A251SV17_HELAN|nr:hypothetical protein HanXRQr2_Chr13g0599271 [Helianthus annuus]KAJ0477704.1 hypothetical protein HanHA300_Chr13g0491631 [Helianthus annuus]KAJ0482253.1 hypothetical protein HanIR_Chr13g0651851 [Helianthus annuus]KAJ0498537.1 hypothetical protein HanHA89_Chr13g0523761 [Helianthus annuus]KAJ0664551.1 hypothetical protein HanLR1_Chr13g0493751 [Helianthus annuus]
MYTVKKSKKKINIFSISYHCSSATVRQDFFCLFKLTTNLFDFFFCHACLLQFSPQFSKILHNLRPDIRQSSE